MMIVKKCSEKKTKNDNKILTFVEFWLNKNKWIYIDYDKDV